MQKCVGRNERAGGRKRETVVHEKQLSLDWPDVINPVYVLCRVWQTHGSVGTTSGSRRRKQSE